MAIHFEITGENTGFMRSINEIHDAVVKTSQLVEQVAKKYGVQAEQLATAVDKIGKVEKEAGDAAQKAGKVGVNAAKDVEKAIDKTDKTVGKLNKDVDSSAAGFGKLAKAAGAFFTLQAAQSFAKSIFAVRSEIQSLQTSFRILVGDKDKADALFNSIKEFAVSTPMQMKDLASAAQTMMGFGIPLEQIMENLKAIGDVSMGDSQRFQALALSFSQMSAAGKLMGQDLMQMINAGFNPLATIAEKTGKSIGKLKDEMSEGKISAEMIRQAFIDATSAGGKFHGMLEEQSKTLNGAFSNLQGAIDDMLNGLGEKTEGVFASAIDMATVLVKNFETIGTVLLSVVKAYGAYRAGLLITMALEKSAAVSRLANIKGLTSMGLAIDMCKNKMLALGKVLKTNVWGIALATLSLLADALGLFGKNAKNAAEISEKFGEAAEKATHNAKALFAALDNTAKGTKVHRDIIKELSALYKEYGIEVKKLKDDFSNEAEVVKDLTEKHNDLMLAIRAETIERQKANAIQTFSEDYQNAIKDAWADMKDEIGGDKSNTITASLQLAISEQDLVKLGELRKRIEELQDGDATFEQLREAGVAYQKHLTVLEDKIKRVGDEFGLSDKKIAYMGRSLNRMGKSIYEANGVLQQAINTVNEGAKAVDGYSDSADRAAYANRLSKMSVSELQNELRNLIANYNNTTIGVKIVYDEVNVPSWMNGMSLERTRELSESFANMLYNNPNAQTFNVNGKKMSRQQVTERAVGYGKAAAQKKAAADAKKAAADAAKTKKGTKTNKSGNSTGLSAEEIAEKEFETQARQTRERERAVRDMELSTREAQIKAMEEGTAKAVAQIALDKDKEMEAIRRSYEDLRQTRIEEAKTTWENNPNNKKKNFFTSDAYKTAASDERYTQQEKDNRIEREKAALAEFDRQMNEVHRAEIQSMRDYLKEYGNMEEQRLAITEEYNEKIRRAATMGEKMALKEQLKSALADFDTKQANVDWEAIFGNLTAYTSEELKKFKEQLRSTMSEGNMEVDQYKAIVERIDEINTAILSAESDENAFLGMALKGGEQRRRLTMEEAEARKLVADAARRQLEAEQKLQKSQGDVSVLLRTNGIKYSGDITAANQGSILRAASDKLGGTGSEAYKALEKAMLSLASTESQYNKTRKVSEQAERKHVAALKNLNTYLGDWKKKLGDLMPMFEQINANIQSLPDLSASLFGENSGVTKGAQQVAGVANDAMGAMADYASGNYVGAATKAFSAVGQLGEMIGLGGLSDKTLEKDIEKLTQSNENLMKALDALTEEMSDASFLDIKDIYSQQKKTLEQTIANYQEMMQRSGKAYNTGWLGLGIGGSGSSNKAIDKQLKASDWQAVSSAAGVSVSSAAEFWQLSSKQMYLVMRDANAQWTEIMDKANDGTADAAKFMNEYIELWKKEEEIERQYRERWTSISFDGVRDSFMDALSDMDKSAADFSKDFTKYMFDAVMNAKVGDMLDKELSDWYNHFAEKMEKANGDVTEAETNALRAEWDSIVQKGMELRDRIAMVTGYDSVGGEDNATFKSASSFTQEQGDVLNGRLAAIQIAVQQNNAFAQQIKTTIDTMAAMSSASASANTAVLEIRDMMVIGNQYLDDVATYTKKIYADFAGKIDQLVTNTQYM